MFIIIESSFFLIDKSMLILSFESITCIWLKQAIDHRWLHMSQHMSDGCLHQTNILKNSDENKTEIEKI